MIDRASRDALAELARHFVAGRITNDQLEGRLPNSNDCAIHEIWWNALWGLYDDFYEHRLVGRHYVPRDSRTDLARCILFLKTDLEYEWTPYPPEPKLLTMLLSLATLGFANRVMARHWRQQGDSSVWPFFREADYRGALERPSVSRVRLLTIVGGGRDAWSVWRRGSRERLWARGACPAWSCGPSTSPLDG